MSGESLESIAQRLERAADRSQNAGFLAAARSARDAAQQVRGAPSLEAALAIEQAFLATATAVPAAAPSRSWWWWLTHPSSWGSSSDYRSSSDYVYSSSHFSDDS